jgi:hypothetical protein
VQTFTFDSCKFWWRLSIAPVYLRWICTLVPIQAILARGAFPIQQSVAQITTYEYISWFNIYCKYETIEWEYECSNRNDSFLWWPQTFLFEDILRIVDVYLRYICTFAPLWDELGKAAIPNTTVCCQTCDRGETGLRNGYWSEGPRVISNHGAMHSFYGLAQSLPIVLMGRYCEAGVQWGPSLWVI